MLSGRQKVMGESAVIGNQQQSFGIPIQPSHGKKTVLFRQVKVIHHGSVMMISGGRDTACRFMEHIIFIFRITDFLSVRLNLFRFIIHLCLRLFYRFSIDRYTAASDEAFHFASCSDPGICQQFVQSYHSHYCILHPG